jgi:hypothetical protein
VTNLYQYVNNKIAKEKLAKNTIVKLSHEELKAYGFGSLDTYSLLNKS